MAVKRNVSIIIPNYNGADLLKQYLPYTFAAADHADVVYEVIVVDAASTDDSIAFVQAHYPQVVLVKNATNIGLPSSCDEGMKVAQYDLLLCLNSDVKLSPAYFEHQWTYFEQGDRCGVMGRLMGADQQRMEDTARYPKFMGSRTKATSFS